VRTLASLWTWAVLATISILGFFVALPLLVVTLAFDRRRAVVGRFVRLLGVVIAKANPLWSFHIHGAIGAYRPRRTVVIANHVSNSDAFLIAHLPWEMKWLGKSSLFFIPFLGWLLAVAGDVAVKRGTKDSVAQAMRQCRWYLEQGMPVMIFPEGTRSGTGELLPFKDGAFRLAIEAEADILPIAVAGTRSALPKHSWRFGRSIGWVTVGEPIATAGLSLTDVEPLKARAREAIITLRHRIESG
jgi:1-acyl-sn-glycerol-3-phosphate acyltransferase